MLIGCHINDFHFTCGVKIGFNLRMLVSFKCIDYTETFVEGSNNVWKTKSWVDLLQHRYKNTNFLHRKTFLFLKTNPSIHAHGWRNIFAALNPNHKVDSLTFRVIQLMSCSKELLLYLLNLPDEFLQLYNWYSFLW